MDAFDKIEGMSPHVFSMHHPPLHWAEEPHKELPSIVPTDYQVRFAHCLNHQHTVCVTHKFLAVLWHLLVMVSILLSEATCADTRTAVAQEGEVKSKVVCDAGTKICYSSYSDAESGMTFGLALPKNVTDPYDAIIKITAPIANKWAGFSWGGNMVWNPLSVAWANGNSGTISARFAL